MMSALDAIVTGRVQGVTFRDFAQRQAHALSLVGEVDNRADGSLHVYAEGEKVNLEKFVLALKKGPSLARVENVAYTEVKPKGEYDSFSIQYE